MKDSPAGKRRSPLISSYSWARPWRKAAVVVVVDDVLSFYSVFFTTFARARALNGGRISYQGFELGFIVPPRRIFSPFFLLCHIRLKRRNRWWFLFLAGIQSSLANKADLFPLLTVNFYTRGKAKQKRRIYILLLLHYVIRMVSWARLCGRYIAISGILIGRLEGAFPSALILSSCWLLASPSVINFPPSLASIMWWTISLDCTSFQILLS